MLVALSNGWRQKHFVNMRTDATNLNCLSCFFISCINGIYKLSVIICIIKFKIPDNLFGTPDICIYFILINLYQLWFKAQKDFIWFMILKLSTLYSTLFHFWLAYGVNCWDDISTQIKYSHFKRKGLEFQQMLVSMTVVKGCVKDSSLFVNYSLLIIHKRLNNTRGFDLHSISIIYSKLISALNHVSIFFLWK